MILMIDNYDSFVFNLYQYLGTLNPDITVVRNDALSVEEIAALKPERIVLSPGPGRPSDSGVCPRVIRELGADVPILGVCLGHQAICEVHGARVGYASRLMHGKCSEISIDTTSPLFTGLPERITVARYHSLAADPSTIPPELRVLAQTDDGEVMAVSHVSKPIFGVQFHPESILTPDGMRILENFLACT